MVQLSSPTFSAAYTRPLVFLGKIEAEACGVVQQVGRSRQPAMGALERTVLCGASGLLPLEYKERSAASPLDNNVLAITLRNP